MARLYFSDEASIAWSFNKRDLTATVLPFSLFTIASSLKSREPAPKIVLHTFNSALLGFLLLYTFTVSNQINGVEEDRLNKPDRPIVSGRVTLKGAYTRYTISSILALAFSSALNVQIGAISFMAFGALHNFTNVSAFGPSKDVVTTSVLVSGLYTAWKLGGGTVETGGKWIMCIAVNLVFSISIQDLRDIIGDAATGRYTTPLMLGSPYDRLYISWSILFFRVITLPWQYFSSTNSYASIICASTVVALDLYLVFRVLWLRSIAEDKKTYRIYMLLFSLEPLLASFVLAA